MKKLHRLALVLSMLITTVTLSACGGAGSSSQSSLTTPQASKAISGVAAVGRPLSGTVYLSDASTPARTISVAITADGTFSFTGSTLQGMKAPYLLKAVEPTGATWYTFARTEGLANINPITTIAVAAASGSGDTETLAQFYASHDATALDDLSRALPTAISQLMSALKPLLSIYGAADTDPLSGSYRVDQQGLDGFLDQVDFSLTQGAVLITNRSTGQTVFSAPITNVTSGSADPAALPQPAPIKLTDNAGLTLAVKGTLLPGTVIRSATFTLRLPRGVTVNSVTPIGGASGANIYAPTGVSQNGNEVTITLTSLNGFGAGNFLSIRCSLDSTSLADLGTADFTTVSAALYSDIYQSQPVSGLSVVPTDFFTPTRVIYPVPVTVQGS